MGVDRILPQAVHDAVEVADSAPVMLFLIRDAVFGELQVFGMLLWCSRNYAK